LTLFIVASLTSTQLVFLGRVRFSGDKVDESDLRLRLSDRTLVRAIELHATAACASAIHAQSVNVENVALIEKVLTIKVKEGPKPPKVARLTHVLTGAPDSGTYFLKVTGTGITPIGGSCQPQFTSQGTLLPCASQVGNEVYFTACNVNVRDGSGSTAGPVNALGNLVVGYNEGVPASKSGSHNLVVGNDHTYSNYGGIVGGAANTVSGPYASVTGGRFNTASGVGASVTGGDANTATGDLSSIQGGSVNFATGVWSSVSGGIYNEANGGFATVSGGNDRTAPGDHDWVGGGLFEDD